MVIEIEKLPSGFFMVKVNHIWIDASIPTLEAAREKAASLVQLENRRQIETNHFRNIEIIEFI